jgi:hypothetical protein
MQKSTKIATIGMVIVVLAITTRASYKSITQNKSLVEQVPAEESQSLEDLQKEMAQIAEYEFKNGCLEKNARGQNVFCGESKQKVDAAEARYQAALYASTVPDSATEEADMSAVRNFMGDQSMSLKYSRSGAPANFSVGILTPLSGKGDFKLETPTEWKRMVNVYIATKEIEGTCEVYEYEVYPLTHEVVEVRVVYPRGYQGQCTKGDLFSTLVPESEIKMRAEEYLVRENPRRVNELKDEMDVYTITKLSRGGINRWEWKWQDTTYKLPNGMSGKSAVDSMPTVRLHIASSGKLVQYNNTIPLFKTP